jgi:uncharacterized damage-inducible protein DinB
MTFPLGNVAVLSRGTITRLTSYHAQGPKQRKLQFMPRQYRESAVPDSQVPIASSPWLQHVLDTYASETNKVVSVWRSFDDADLSYTPHERSSSVVDVLKHQLLSERRFFGEFLGSEEPPAAAVLPRTTSVASFTHRFVELAVPRLAFLATQPSDWWFAHAPFFDVERERIWIFWRRVLHTAHHRTQLTVYLRLLGRRVPAIYGPTADESWDDADPTTSVEAAERK